MNELIAVRQLPIIEEHLKTLSVEIDKQVSDALSLAVTEETVKDVKVVRANLNKQYKDLEAQRKAVKKAILEPYEAFDDIYKTYVSVRFEEADSELKRKIGAVEAQLRQEKIDDLQSYFRELADSEHLDWLDYERGGFNVTLTKSRTALHKEVDDFIGRVAESVRTIVALPDADEVAAEYKRTLSLGKAVETVQARHKAIEQERKEREHLEGIRKAEAETARRAREAAKEASEPPVAVQEEEKESDPVRTLTFTVTAPISKLRDLKRFLTEGGYNIG